MRPVKEATALEVSELRPPVDRCKRRLEAWRNPAGQACGEECTGVGLRRREAGPVKQELNLRHVPMFRRAVVMKHHRV